MPIDDFKAGNNVFRIVDEYQAMLDELYRIRHPHLRFAPPDPSAQARFIDEHVAGRPLTECGNWIHFPWSGLLIHYLPAADHHALRTARNRLLITDYEQQALRDFHVGIAGLSVGSHAALTLTMMGGARQLRLADPDRISGSNLNRLRLDFSHVGTYKCDAVAGLILQTDPYAQLDTYRDGVNADNLADFMQGLGVLVECMDDLEMKVRARLMARQMGIPVLMATDNGDGVILDVERYDLDPATEPFNGAAGPMTIERLHACPPEELPKLATRIAGIDCVHPRMLRSVSLIGVELYSWPQLGTAATMTGVVLAYAIRRLANRLPLPSGRTLIDPEALLDPGYHEPAARLERRHLRLHALRALGFDEAELAVEVRS